MENTDLNEYQPKVICKCPRCQKDIVSKVDIVSITYRNKLTNKTMILCRRCNEKSKQELISSYTKEYHEELKKNRFHAYIVAFIGLFVTIAAFVPLIIFNYYLYASLTAAIGLWTTSFICTLILKTVVSYQAMADMASDLEEGNLSKNHEAVPLRLLEGAPRFLFGLIMPLVYIGSPVVFFISLYRSYDYQTKPVRFIAIPRLNKAQFYSSLEESFNNKNNQN